MGSPSNDYNSELRNRLKDIKKKKRLTYEQLAELMDCEVRHATSVIKGEALATCEDIANFAKNLPADADYLMYGERKSATKIAQSWVGADDEELANIHIEMAKFFNTRAAILHKNSEPTADFIVGKDTLVETHKRRK